MFCFIWSMNQNVINSHMKNPPLRIEPVIPPDDHYKPRLYSDIGATTAFNRLNHDIYQGVQKSKSLKEKYRKTPLPVKILYGVLLTATTILGIRKLIKR